MGDLRAEGQVRTGRFKTAFSAHDPIPNVHVCPSDRRTDFVNADDGSASVAPCPSKEGKGHLVETYADGRLYERWPSP